MAHVQLIFDPSLEVDAREVAALWVSDPEAAAVMDGPPEVRREPSSMYLPSLVEFVVIPLAVNVGSTVLIALATKIYRRYRPDGDVRVERADDGGPDGDLTIATTAGSADDAETEPPA